MQKPEDQGREKIETEIAKGGSRVENGFYVDKRDRLTRKVRWEQLDRLTA